MIVYCGNFLDWLPRDLTRLLRYTMTLVPFGDEWILKLFSNLGHLFVVHSRLRGSIFQLIILSVLI